MDQFLAGTSFPRSVLASHQVSWVPNVLNGANFMVFTGRQPDMERSRIHQSKDLHARKPPLCPSCGAGRAPPRLATWHLDLGQQVDARSVAGAARAIQKAFHRAKAAV